MSRKGRKNKSYNQFSKIPPELVISLISITMLSSFIYSGAFGIDSENDAKWKIDASTSQLIKDCTEQFESGDGSKYHKLCLKLMDTLDAWKSDSK